MVLMGLRLESWILSWYLTYAFISAIVCFILVVFGLAFEFQVFRNTNFGVLFLTFWFHSLAELAFTFFVAVYIHDTSTAIFFATFWYIFGLLFMSIVFSNSLIAYIWWTKNISNVGWIMLIFLPFFNFGVIFTDIYLYFGYGRC